MDALALDIAVEIIRALSVALLIWGGWLCLGGGSQGRTTDMPEHASALSS